MVGRFEFATATRIIFGRGAIQEVPLLLPSGSKRVLLVRGTRPEASASLQMALQQAGLEVTCWRVGGEPKLAEVWEAVQEARAFGAEVVIGLGGGSVLDTGKIIAAMLRNPGELLDYLEVIGRAQPLKMPSVPYLAIPTTAGTGAEVTRNAVLESPEHQVKVSMRSPWMLPALAVIDPELTCSMPPALTASTGLDALTQVIEPYVCNQTNPLTDALCREGIQRASQSLKQAYHNGQDLSAREDLALTSLFGGLALANAKLGAVHGLAGPLGGMLSAPHGMLCACLLPHVMQTNVKALGERLPDSPLLKRYKEVAQLLTGQPQAQAEDGVHWLLKLCAELQVPSLSTFGLQPRDFARVLLAAQKSSSMKGNPLGLTEAELIDILERAL